MEIECTTFAVTGTNKKIEDDVQERVSTSEGTAVYVDDELTMAEWEDVDAGSLCTVDLESPCEIVKTEDNAIFAVPAVPPLRHHTVHSAEPPDVDLFDLVESMSDQNESTEEVKKECLKLTVYYFYYKPLLPVMKTAMMTEKERCDMQIPVIPEFLCDRITHEIFQDPVVTPGGITYERKNIEEHLNTVGNFDPLTHVRLTADDILPDHRVRIALDEFTAMNPEVVTAAASEQEMKHVESPQSAPTYTLELENSTEIDTTSV